MSKVSITVNADKDTPKVIVELTRQVFEEQGERLAVDIRDFDLDRIAVTTTKEENEYSIRMWDVREIGDEVVADWTLFEIPGRSLGEGSRRVSAGTFRYDVARASN